jgi:hypothetical protein
MTGAQTKERTMSTATTDQPIVIRVATDDDAPALRRLAQLDGARLPQGELLVAEAGGEIRVALSISDRAYVADPFYPSKELVGLLDVRARRLRQDTYSRGERAKARLDLWGALWHRAATTRPSV